METPNAAYGEGADTCYEPTAYLLGVPTLSDFIKFVQRRTADGYERHESELVGQWSRVDDRYRVLETDEENLPDNIGKMALPARMTRLLDRTLQDRYFTRCFEALPVSFAMVELDKLLVIQEDVSLEQVQRVCNRLGDAPDDEEFFRLCLPYERSEPTVSCVQNGTNSYVFQSASSDLRAFPSQLLSEALKAQVPANGPVAQAIALTVGFGPNYLNGIRFGKRIILNNGYHRAYALRSMGITHAPMAIQVISRAEELAFVSGDKKADFLEFLVKSKRPPVLKDFFDPLLAITLPCLRLRRQVQVKIEIAVQEVPAI